MPNVFPGYPEIFVDYNVPLQLAHGVCLYSDVYRPKTNQLLPVLLTRTPYDKTEAGSNLGFAHPAWYAAQGYIVVAQDVRGRWASEGNFYPFRHEAEDGRVALRWASELPGSSGRVGMYGFSYGGATQLLTTISAPPELEAICPAFTWSRAYDCIYTNGAFNLAFAAGWAILLAQETALRSKDEKWLAALQQGYRDILNHCWSLPLTSLPPLQGGQAPYYFDWLKHPQIDSYWSNWAIEGNYHQIDTPSLHIGGWYDAFIKGTVANFVGLKSHASSERARRSQKLLIGPWWHMPWNPLLGDIGFENVKSSGPNAVDDWQIRWFDRFLKNQETGVLDYPVTVFQMGKGWLDLDNWPPKDSRYEYFFLHSQGRANSAFGDGFLSLNAPNEEPPDIFFYSPSMPALSAGGHSCCRSGLAPMGPADQAAREAGKGVLVYTSPVLEKELSVIGNVKFILFAASTAEDTDFTARLCRVTPSGLSTNITEGVIRARFRETLSTPKPIAPGCVYEYRINLGPVCIRLNPGERFRLTVSSSDFPMWDRNQNNGLPVGLENPLLPVSAVQTILHNREYPSRLVLPVVP